MTDNTKNKWSVWINLILTTVTAVLTSWYLPELGYAIPDAKLLRLFPTAQNPPKNPLRFYISLEIGPIEYEKRINNHTIKC